MSRLSLRVVLAHTTPTATTAHQREDARIGIGQELHVGEWSHLVQIGEESIETGEHEWFFTITAPRLRKKWIKGAERLRRQSIIDRYIVSGNDEAKERVNDGE